MDYDRANYCRMNATNFSQKYCSKAEIWVLKVTYTAKSWKEILNFDFWLSILTKQTIASLLVKKNFKSNTPRPSYWVSKFEILKWPKKEPKLGIKKFLKFTHVLYYYDREKWGDNNAIKIFQKYYLPDWAYKR